MKVLLTCGAAGSGKTTYKYGEGFFILSSDAVRGELFGDEACQQNHALVFNVLREKLAAHLSLGHNVVIDATNMTRKNRRPLMEVVKKYKADCEAMVFAVPYEVLCARQMKRSRHVPEEAIWNQLLRFEMPLYAEGFSKINIINNATEVVGYNMKNFNQQNHHHTLDLDGHCKACYDGVRYTDDASIMEAALWHDVGKLMTKSEPDENGDCHYYNHQNIGAYMYLCAGGRDVKAAQLINYHMLPYNKNFKYGGFEEIKKELMLLHEADKEAH